MPLYWRTGQRRNALEKERSIPTFITHAIVGAAAVKTLYPADRSRLLIAAAMITAMLPDADVLGFPLGVEYGDFFGHRGFFHSIFFALVVAVLCVQVVFRGPGRFSREWRNCALFFFAVGATHGLLDALTDGGLGIALLSPFDRTRYFFPWTPIPVSPIGLADFLSAWGLHVLAWEAALVWLPAFAVVAACMLIRRSASAR
ncbi:MAG: metal-dependent hydrolase [Verrucomicrobia bacterium]|nr:metal-dependent hydrolase [Verrucomicrobiota bacterium]